MWPKLVVQGNMVFGKWVGVGMFGLLKHLFTVQPKPVE